MTRYTNLGRKRTHVAAGFSHNDAEPPEPQSEASTSALLAAEAGPTTAETEPASQKKKRKRSKKSRGKGKAVGADVKEDSVHIAEGGGPAPNTASDGDKGAPAKTTKVKKSKERSKEKNFEKRKDAADRAASSEKRRLKRIAERHANKICFACREMGHAAQMCPNVKQIESGGANASVNIAGICYRCGSKKHTLSRCRKPVNDTNPMPFASCFVCSGKGHLASACPENKEKGIYPNGGSCKLCGETKHLARDCPMRTADVNMGSSILGTGREAGADEDDFHIFRRNNFEVDRELQGEDRIRKIAKVRAGKVSGIVKAFGSIPQPNSKKVVNF